MSTSTSCQAAYHSICVNANGTIEPCCQYDSDFKIRTKHHYTKFDQYLADIPTKMQADAAAGIEHAGCVKCYREERHGWRSLRQHQNTWYPSNVTAISADNPIYDLELRLGNFCNLKCIMCGPASSSSIAAERYTYQDRFIKIGAQVDQGDMPYYWKDEEFKQFAQTVLTNNVRRVNITGGEPFIIPEVVKFLEMLMPRCDTVVLSFNTNLTEVGNKLLTAMQKFKNIEISISLEGAGAMNDYVRHPSRWSDIESNIQLLKQELPQARLSINHVLQHTSAYALPGLMAFTKLQNLSVHITTISGYPHMSLNSVPTDHLVPFRVWAESSTDIDHKQRSLIVGMIDSACYDGELYRKFKEYIDLLDDIRNTNYLAVFPQANIS
jgi:sulfatase maturation enzyme AslB (radical SAM superfamily)